MILKQTIQTLSTVVLLCVIGFNLSCKSANTMSEAEASEQLAELETLLHDNAFRVDIKTVYPFNTAATNDVLNSILIPGTSNSASWIDVANDGHFIEFSTTATKGDLPFFGEQRISGGYNIGNDNNIQFDGAPIDYSISKHKKKSVLEIAYDVNDSRVSTETYEIQFLVYPNKTVHVFITSTLKTVIHYRGTLQFTDTTEPES
ncbi:DUF4251 domain-containing protein [Winogradskyella sp.]|uniref:DUF4251 domain-containing protein n=1 Tax=Winogradskyella sp. TaxID=1883156 RepID=UPI00262E6BCA|nr:DUF4251 domain-containing protein [Winogradskyella sp.]